jgi:hypothetical protein
MFVFRSFSYSTLSIAKQLVALLERKARFPSTKWFSSFYFHEE